MRSGLFIPFFAISVFTGAVLGKGDGSFQAPLSLKGGTPGPITVHAGDFNHDEKLDLVVANGVYSNNASGSNSILVLFQNPSRRDDWTPYPIKVGTSTVFVQTGDVDGDGIDDVLAGDPATTGYFIRSKGDGTFDRPVQITQARGVRWIAVGDWNKDGKLDIATANLASSSITAFIGDGTGKFTLTQTIPGSREHVMEALDFDGDGKLDLALGTGLPGITPLRGLGDGKFQAKANVTVFSCVEYIATGDFNLDGKSDVSPTCIDDGNAYAGISLGTGAYKRTLGPFAGGGGTESSAIADLNGDGKPDLALVSNASTTLWVHPGKGDGAFLPPVLFGPVGANPVFLIAHDLDGDGHVDVVSADQVSFSLTVFWGKDDPRFMESGYSVGGFASSKAMGTGDLDGDGLPDLFFPNSSLPKVQVYLKPAGTSPTKPSLQIDTKFKYTSLEVVDLDGDGVPDLAGSNQTEGTALVALLNAAGTVKSEVALPAGALAGAVRVGLIDEGATLDLAVPCAGVNYVSIFLGQGSGAFADSKNIPTIEKPKSVALSDVDGDGRTDLAVMSLTTVAFQIGKGAGDFGEPVTVILDATKLYSDLAFGDLDGDGIQDLVLADQKALSLLVFRGKGKGEMEAPVSLAVPKAPVMLGLADLNGDGLLDITASSSTSSSASILLNRGPNGFSSPVNYRVGFSCAGHRLVDLDRDGALDVVAFGSSAAMVLRGKTESTDVHRFRRGDASGDGPIDLADPILLLNALFLGGLPPACEDAADANDDGTLNLTDPILILNRLFLAGDLLPPPGPDCGEDPTADQLHSCSTSC